jgi:membrane protease YdiL (CAAX protease family)
MLWERVRAGLVSGIVGFAPLVLVILLTRLGALSGDLAVSVALLAFPVCILLGGGLSGYLAGQGRRRRSEAKVIVGGTTGLVAALLFGIILVIFYFVRAASASPADVLSTHPIRVIFAVLLIGALMVAVAMATTQLTAKPLPPRGQTRQMPAVRPPAAASSVPRGPGTPVR